MARLQFLGAPGEVKTSPMLSWRVHGTLMSTPFLDRLHGQIVAEYDSLHRRHGE